MERTRVIRQYVDLERAELDFIQNVPETARSLDHEIRMKCPFRLQRYGTLTRIRSCHFCRQQLKIGIRTGYDGLLRQVTASIPQ